MGTEAFAEAVFNKVYKTDIERLRSTRELWKFRRRPDALDYATASEKTPTGQEAKEAILKDGQRVWNLEENLVVFKDRYTPLVVAHRRD